MTKKQTLKKITSVKKHVNKQVKRRATLTFVPHKANQYRPHLVRRYGLAVLLVGIIGVQLLYNVTKTGEILGQESQVSVGELLAATNQARVDNNEPTLALNEQLTKAAYLKARDMLAKQYWSHESPDGTQPWQWFSDVDYNYADAGENLAKNFANSQAVVSAWLDSPTHRDNVLKQSYKDVGFAVVEGELQGKKASLVVALYGSPAVASVAGASVENEPAKFMAADTSARLSPVAHLGVALQSLTPAAIGSIAVLLFATVVAFVAHANRRKLPKVLRQSWYHHHGLYKAGGLLSLVVMIVMLYGGGQI